MRTLHFDLAKGHLRTQCATLSLRVGGQQFDLMPHDDTSLALAAKSNMALAMAVRSNTHGFSHYAEVPESCFLPHHVTLMKVVGEKNGPHASSLPDLYHLSYHIPDAHIRRYARRQAAKLAARNGGLALPGKLAAYGVTSAHLQLQKSLDISDLFVAASSLATPWDTACSILFSHPELASSQGYTAAIVMNDHIAPPPEVDPQQYNRVYELSLLISSQGPATEFGGFATYAQVVDPNTGLGMIYEYDWEGENGELIFPQGDPVMQYNLSAETESGCGAPVSYALSTARNDSSLQNKSWSVNQSQSVDSREYLTESDRARSVSVQGKANASIWTATNQTPNHGMNVYPGSIVYDPVKKNFAIDFKNTYLRQLGVFIEFFEDTTMQKPINNPTVNGTWPFYFPQSMASWFETPSQKSIGVLSNVNTIMGIPMPTDPTNFSTPWPSEAQAARFLFGGLGTSNWQEPIVWPGVILTSMFQYAIPTLCMLGGAAVTDSQWYKDFINDKDNVAALAGIAFPMLAGTTTVAAALLNTKQVLFTVANVAMGILAKKGMEVLATYVATRIAAAMAIEATPVVGWAVRLAAIALDMAQMAVTTGELLSSPATLEVDIKRQMTLSFTLHPDPAHGEKGRPETAIWPPVGASCVVNVEYTNGTYYTQTQLLPETGSNTPLVFNFANIGWGGTLKIKANVFSANGWLAGAYVSELLAAQPDNADIGIMAVDGTIKEMLVPLTQLTQYEYWQQLNYDKAQNKHTWIKGSPPATTLEGINCSNVGHNICKLVNMTILNEDYQVGYCYQASGENIPLEDPNSPPNSGQMYVLQNISILSVDSLNERLKQSEVGFKVQPLIAYNTFGVGPDEKTITPYNFIVDSRFGKYYLRQIDLRDGSHTFGLIDANKSWGTFIIPHLDAMIVHPSGYVIAVSWQYSKMQILQLGEGPVDDALAPEAQIVSSQGVLQGLTHGPIALAVTPDGRVLLLETQNARVQAFDTKGNPVPSFPGAQRFTLPTADYVATLDAEVFSPALQAAFRDNGLTFLFANSNPDFRRALDGAVLNEIIIAAFAEEGVFLCYNQTAEGGIDPVGSSTVTVVTPGSRWVVTDPQMPASYTLWLANGAVQVSDDLTAVDVKMMARGVKWQINDRAGARSYLLTVDPAKPAEISVADYLSYMPLHQPAGITYLDIAVEAKGYIYVLSHRGDGMRPSDYILDIYQPDGRFLVTSPDAALIPDPAKRQYLAAARLVVDPFRTVVALNYGSFLGPNDRTEPVVSQWTPSTPLFDLDIATLPIFQQGDMTQIRSLFASKGHPLSASATLVTINPAGHFDVLDAPLHYPVVATVNGDDQQVISVYGFPL